MIIFLDAGPLGLVTNPRANDKSKACGEWLLACLEAGARVCIPEIADYEVRRELLRAAKTKGLSRLDELQHSVEYVPLTTAAMIKAAEFWATARNAGKPTAAMEALDADVILAAQALTAGDANAVVATTNVGHLSRFVTAKTWSEIAPE